MSFEDKWKQLCESPSFDNWVKPSEKDARYEYTREYKYLKGGLSQQFTEDEWIDMYNKGEVTEITPDMDSGMGYRSHTTSKESLLGLIRGYSSYPKLRNEKTVQDIYDGFENNSPMKMPIVLRYPNGRLRVFGGNTRMDVANQLDVPIKAIIVDIPG